MAILNRIVFSLCIAFAAAADAGAPPEIGLLYWVGGNQLSRATPAGDRFEVLVSGLEAPDGLAVDLAKDRVYWTNMGQGPNGDVSVPRGSLQRATLDGSPLGDGGHLLPPGSFTTGKEIELHREAGKLYWADREGGRILRANTDGSNVETLLSGFEQHNGETRKLKNAVGVALDTRRRQVYMTDRLLGLILRFPMDKPDQQSSFRRTDVEVLVEPRSDEDRPIDIDLDPEAGAMYWTDRGAREIRRATLDGQDMQVILDASRVAMENPIGISLDSARDQFYWSDMSTHQIHRAALDGSHVEKIIGGERLLDGLPYGPLGVKHVAVEPTSGPVAGGEEVFVAGAGFAPKETVVRLGEEVVRAQVESPNRLRFVTPPGEPGWARLSVITPHGETHLQSAYRYR